MQDPASVPLPFVEACNEVFAISWLSDDSVNDLRRLLLPARACTAWVCVLMACSDCGPGSPSSHRETDGAPKPPDGGVEVEGMPALPDAAPSTADGPEAGADATALDAGAGAGMASDVAEGACPRDLPAGCESPVPSWMNVVQPIIAQRCNACHGVGGVEQAAFDFSTYEGVRKAFGSVLNSVYGCLMPPPDAGALTPEERQAVLGWLVCSAPNN